MSRAPLTMNIPEIRQQIVAKELGGVHVGRGAD